jgi:hypothetical protein
VCDGQHQAVRTEILNQQLAKRRIVVNQQYLWQLRSQISLSPEWQIAICSEWHQVLPQPERMRHPVVTLASTLPSLSGEVVKMQQKAHHVAPLYLTLHM